VPQNLSGNCVEETDISNHWESTPILISRSLLHVSRKYSLHKDPILNNDNSAPVLKYCMPTC
jgi:hypothetical protein